MLLELKRQLFHALYGIIILILLQYYSKSFIVLVLFVLVIIGLILSQKSKTKKIPIISPILNIFDRKKDLKTHPGKGAVTLTIGFFIALLFPLTIAKVAILILALGDASSTIGGKLFGRTKISKNKTLEGTIAGIIISTLAALIYVPLIPAVATSTLAMFSEHFETKWLDDNIIIPIVSGIVLICLI